MAPGRLSQTDKKRWKEFRGRAAGDVCRGQKAPLHVQANSFSKVSQFEKLALAGRKDFFDTLKPTVEYSTVGFVL